MNFQYAVFYMLQFVPFCVNFSNQILIPAETYLELLMYNFLCCVLKLLNILNKSFHTLQLKLSKVNFLLTLCVVRDLLNIWQTQNTCDGVSYVQKEKKHTRYRWDFTSRISNVNAECRLLT